MSLLLFSLIFGLFIGAALSIDAFLLSLIYGSTIKKKRELLLVSSTVGVLHFILPLCGYVFIHLTLKNILSIPLLKQFFNQLGAIIFLILGFTMLSKSKENNQTTTLKSIFGILLFSLSVSLDSFFIGIAIRTSHRYNIFLMSLLFFLISFTSTYIALRLVHSKTKVKPVDKLNTIAGVLFILFGIIYLLFN